MRVKHKITKKVISGLITVLTLTEPVYSKPLYSAYAFKEYINSEIWQGKSLLWKGEIDTKECYELKKNGSFNKELSNFLLSKSIFFLKYSLTASSLKSTFFVYLISLILS